MSLTRIEKEKEMAKNGQRFDTGFKLEVAQMIRDQGLSVLGVCRSMDLVETTVRRWLAQYDAERTGGAGVGRPLTGLPQLRI